MNMYQRLADLLVADGTQRTESGNICYGLDELLGYSVDAEQLAEELWKREEVADTAHTRGKDRQTMKNISIYIRLINDAQSIDSLGFVYECMKSDKRQGRLDKQEYYNLYQVYVAKYNSLV